MRNLLIFALVASGLAPVYLGAMSFISYEKALSILNMSTFPDSFQLTALAGICMLITAGVQFIAAYWVYTHNKSGIFLSNYIGYAMLFGGVMTFTILHRMDISALYGATGLIVLSLTYLYKRSRIDDEYKTS